ncbi:hypothetical protein [Blastopirellula marina]|uniref:Uncharacterized protein n=1 Tax=Blastopirellula marina TaxID=124 RepID=A0A2S8FAM9_9BACT|nr:hypothetical protein [Blastopirellula marina]PQO28984.1 hypothetical protein C5Y98_22495 [Blastopirellula marina]PQO43865.1 hypothetical protein C5Y93_22020 [Blastopirellula marina]PTL42256.1 hypothetical protein C5Y97_22505 [Blastopirellula marina]
MPVTAAQIDLVLRTVENDQLLFNSLSAGEATSPFYHLQADALCWEDEVPHDLSYQSQRVVMFLLAVRSQSYLDSAPEMAELVQQLRQIAPAWPFLRPDRFDKQWQATLAALRDAAFKNLERELQQRKRGRSQPE